MEKRLVLVTDDDENIRALYTEALTASGIEVITATNGKEAVVMALTQHPDVILMDILMPEVNGHEAMKQIRSDTWGKTARVIYLTNLTEPENVVEAFEQKPEEYIIKVHTDVKEVINKVRTALYQK